MSILINGIEMPKVCEECPCFVFVDTGTMPSCCALHEDMGIEQAESYRLKNCPLVPVPDHGDLIDRDEAADDTCLIWSKNSDSSDAMQETIEHLRHGINAVIPAERSEE